MEPTVPPPPPVQNAPAVVPLRPLHPRVRWLWTLSTATAAVPPIMAVGLFDLAVTTPLPQGLITAVVIVIGAVATAVLPQVRYRRWRYAFRAQDLWIRQGVLWVTTSVIPLSRLQFVDTRQGPLHRLFGLAELIVHTAAVGTSGTVPGLETGEAERLRERLAEGGAGVQPV